MSSNKLLEPNPVEQDRVIADLGSRDGPVLVVTCLIHGNEPAGEHAVRRVLARLEQSDLSAFEGRLVILRGNRGAAARDLRFIDRDLNRIFPTELVPPAKEVSSRDAEYSERNDLLARIETLADEHPEGKRYFVDFHTTSSETLPYLSLPSADDNLRQFASRFPLHRVVGFADEVGGSIDRFFYERGFLGFACEGGQHERTGSATSMEALLWMMLSATGVFPESNGGTPDEAKEARATLDRYVVGDPHEFEIIYRHRLTGQEGFRMNPGYANFHRVADKEVIARDKKGDIRVPHEGYLLMPLYQAAGNDGFFLVRRSSSPLEEREALEV
ncbi:MAG: succinylglutamate desuccinylase/aspartoacylase family protein [Verrucomicrobiota bacterium JB023]|nr:succinylglutamate desuccinylase/aspartoacylase family protein [Verrucomicrobiota bacterium JB023]